MVIPVSFLLSFGENASVVAHLTEQGTIAATKFVNDVNPVAPGNSRIVVRHGAAAPPVDVLLRKGGPRAFLKNLRNSDQSVAAEVAAGDWKATIFPSESFRKVAGPIPVTLAPGQANFVYAVGWLRTGSFTALVQTIQP